MAGTPVVHPAVLPGDLGKHLSWLQHRAQNEHPDPDGAPRGPLRSK
jgi:hypothetical protein